MAQPVDGAHLCRCQRDTIRHATLATRIVAAMAAVQIQQSAGNVGERQCAGVIVAQLMQATTATPIAEQFPFLVGHLLQRLGLPEWQRRIHRAAHYRRGATVARVTAVVVAGSAAAPAHPAADALAHHWKVTAGSPVEAPADSPAAAAASRLAAERRPAATRRRQNGSARRATGRRPDWLLYLDDDLP